jgi:hypothetical protein
LIILPFGKDGLIANKLAVGRPARALLGKKNPPTRRAKEVAENQR